MCYTSQPIFHSPTLRAKITEDFLSESPRKGENLGTIVAYSTRDLSDKGGYDAACDAVSRSRFFTRAWIYSQQHDDPDQLFTFEGVQHQRFDFGDPEDLWSAMQLCSDIVVLPLYDASIVVLPLYDASRRLGLTTQRSKKYSDRIGFVFATRKKLQQASLMTTRLTPKVRAKAQNIMRAEVEVFNQYLRGQGLFHPNPARYQWALPLDKG